jgi:hypothetical protein
MLAEKRPPVISSDVVKDRRGKKMSVLAMIIEWLARQEVMDEGEKDSTFALLFCIQYSVLLHRHIFLI